MYEESLEDYRRKYAQATFWSKEGDEIVPIYIDSFHMNLEGDIFAIVYHHPRTSAEVPVEYLNVLHKTPEGFVNYKDGVLYIVRNAERQWKRGLSKASHYVVNPQKQLVEHLHYSYLAPVRPLIDNLKSFSFSWTMSEMLETFNKKFYSASEAINSIVSQKRFSAAVDSNYAFVPSPNEGVKLMLLRKQNVIGELDKEKELFKLCHKNFLQEAEDFFDKENLYVRISV
jgi:hypothetical protein